MSTTDIATKLESPRPLVYMKPFWIGLAALFVFVAAVRIYETAFGWSAGLDSFSPEFQTYWTTPLSVAIPLALVSGLGLVGFLWRTRDRHLAEIEPRVELARCVVLVQWLAIYGVALYWGLSFFTEQTATWHMTAVRDSDFTPSNIVTFYLAYPIFSIIGLGAFFYARTRLPFFAKGYSLALLVFVVGPFMTIPSVGLAEWGHTCWFMEELFTSPLHWGFAIFGWMALGAFGVSLQILGRIRELIGTNSDSGAENHIADTLAAARKWRGVAPA